MQMGKETDWFEKITIALCLIFSIAITLYHISYEGYKGLTEAQWGSIWAISENGLSLILCAIISILSYGMLKVTMRYLFLPYFFLKLIYHFSCYSGLVLISPEAWNRVWSVVLICQIIVSLFYCLILIHKKNVA
jgi:hypothetical protein